MLTKKTVVGFSTHWKLWHQEINESWSNHPVLIKGYVTKCIPDWVGFLSIKVDDIFDEKKNVSVEIKKEVLQLLAVAAKAHFFMYAKDVLRSSPTVMSIPDLNKPDEVRLGLCYPLKNSDSAIIVSRADMMLLSSGKMSLLRFPVVVPSNCTTWFDWANWKKLESEGAWLQAIKNKPTRKERDTIGAWETVEDFPFGMVLSGLSQYGEKALRECGGKFAQGINSWYIPLGFDHPPIQEYIKFVEESRKNMGDLGSNRINGTIIS